MCLYWRLSDKSDRSDWSDGACRPGRVCVGGWLVLRSLRRRRMPPFAAYAGFRIDGGFNWDVLGNFERVWEFLRALPPITATLCVAAKRRKTAAALCVGGWHYPACRWQERSVNRLQRALPASQYFPSPPKSSQFYRAAPRRSPYSSTLLAAGGRGKPGSTVIGGRQVQ